MDQHASVEQRVAQHYSQENLERRAHRRRQRSRSAHLERFRTGRRKSHRRATSHHRAGRAAGIQGGHAVLDLGCGIGGGSRFFAEQYRCHVTGIDITEDFVRTAEALARRLGLQERMSYRRASALALPFEAGTFDGAIMMHVGMNIEDKDTLFNEVRRVLKQSADSASMTSCSPASAS